MLCLIIFSRKCERVVEAEKRLVLFWDSLVFGRGGGLIVFVGFYLVAVRKGGDFEGKLGGGGGLVWEDWLMV